MADDTTVETQTTQQAKQESCPSSPECSASDKEANSWWCWFCIAQSWAFFLALPELIDIASEASRYFLHWSWQTWAVRCLGVTVIGLIIFSIGILLRTESLRARHRLAAYFAIVSVGFVGWYCLTELSGPFYHFLFKFSPGGILLGALVVGISWRMQWTLEMWARGLSNVALVCFPAVPLFWANTLWSNRYDAALAERPTSVAMSKVATTKSVSIGGAIGRAAAKPSNVYIFVLDAWSYRLTVNDHEVSEELPNLRSFSEQSCCFSSAHAPGCHTSTSMPRFLFQREGDYAIRRGELGFVGDTGFVPVGELESILDSANRQGYRTYMLGWYHPYRRMVGADVDYVHSTCYFDDFGEEFGSRLKSFYWNLSARLLGKPFARVTIGDTEVIRNYSMSRSMDEIVEYTQTTLQDPYSGQFAVFHLPAPHWPFCYGEDGLKELQGYYGAKDVELAQEQLKYTDRVIGQFLETLKANGKFEQSTIVLTSDHTWRFDGAINKYRAKDWAHVPLFIKLPKQKTQTWVREPLSTSRLMSLLKTIQAESFRFEQLEKTVAQGDYYFELSDTETKFDKPRIIH